MLGALVAVTNLVTGTALEKAILDSVPKGTETLNQKAMKMGFELAGAAPGGKQA
jgi:2-oxoglutarate ferredoxin oxidoreductase subunit gamma